MRVTHFFIHNTNKLTVHKDFVEIETIRNEKLNTGRLANELWARHLPVELFRHYIEIIRFGYDAPVVPSRKEAQTHLAHQVTHVSLKNDNAYIKTHS